MRKIKIFSLFLVLTFFVGNVYSKTREDVIRDAVIYSTFSWVVGENNILDEEGYIVGSTIPVPGERDGIDDRMGVVENLDGNNVIPEFVS